MFSSREKTLINYLLDSPDGRTRESLEEWLGVSKRTLYRELSSIEQTLQKRQLSLIKPQKGSYAIVGGEEELLKLQQDVANNQVDTPSIVERQSNLACMLLLADDFLIAEGLAIDLLVSESTIYNDLSVIEQSFEAYNLSLLKKKNSGIIVTGRENERRQLLSNLIYSGTSEYEFFSWINQLMTKFEVPQPSNNFFTFISNEALIFSINQMKLFAKYFGKVTDNQIKQVMIIIALAYDRISQLHFIEQSPNETVQSRKKEHIMANEIIENLSHNLSMEIPLVENQYLEKQLQGVNYKEPQNLLFDTFNISLSFKVRDLIKKVSLNYGVDFSKDEQCYYDLLTHLDAAIRRSDSLPVEIGSPVLQGVKAKYAGLYEEIITGVKEVFPSVQFNGDEIGYLLLHFATSLERYPETTEISALIFCSSGMGTSKILESRFIKYLPEISQITVAKLSEMDQIDFRQFDLIFSTIYLPNFPLHYKMISPLLLDEEVIEVKKMIQQIEPKKKTNLEFSNNQEEGPSFDELFELMNEANQLLQLFQLKQVENQASLEGTISDIMKQLEPKKISDATILTKKILKRHAKAGVGIPKTNLGLFHTSDSKVKVTFFGIYELENSIEIKGMDKQTIQLKRILLMLMPEENNENAQLLLGRISSSIVEKEENLQVYQFGDRQAIYKLLSDLFLREMK